MGTAAGFLNTASSIPGPQQPWLAGAGALLSLFGKKKDPTQDPNYQAGLQVNQFQQNIRDLYSQEAVANTNYFGNDDAKRRATDNNLFTYYQTDPFTSTRDAQSLSDATAGAGQAYQRADANTTAALAARGIGGSVLGGALASNATAHAANTAAAENTLARQRIVTGESNMRSAASLMDTLTNGDYAKQQAALGHESSANNSLYNTYMGLAQGDWQRDAQNDADQGAAMGGLEGAVASYIPPGGITLADILGTGKKKKTAETTDPAVVPGTGSGNLFGYKSGSGFYTI